MKLLKVSCIALICTAMLVAESGCSSMTNTGIGALIGGGKGAGIGAAIGAAVGAGAGTLIGNKMDKQQKQLQEELANQAKVEETTDQNGLRAIKVTFDGGILFPTGKYTLNPQAKADLTRFAASLQSNPETDVKIFGFTDNTGSYAVNERLSGQRADAVLTYLVNSGISPTRLSAQGVPMADYVASNETAEGRALNRRVEIYITANKEMIRQAEAGTLR